MSTHTQDMLSVFLLSPSILSLPHIKNNHCEKDLEHSSSSQKLGKNSWKRWHKLTWMLGEDRPHFWSMVTTGKKWLITSWSQANTSWTTIHWLSSKVIPKAFFKEAIFSVSKLTNKWRWWVKSCLHITGATYCLDKLYLMKSTLVAVKPSGLSVRSSKYDLSLC